ncbi:hypothetical protein MXE84_00365 [Staphylococcus gallinarum]|nr:hypothetical protein [Staphylococcus gallinarum]MCD8917542.1 hypothetical protein [Staphylococcus gallinarum]MEB6054153.1 hypothetical protein [Staphylococcus gallinarum]
MALFTYWLRKRDE